MPNRITTTVSAAAIALLLAAPAWSQRVQLGQALDANPELGSGGRNLPAAGPGFIDPDLIITGNITAGRAFRGFSPISSTSAFGLGTIALPSATLSAFRRDSVGVSDFASGTIPLSPQPFFFPSQTVLNVGQISVGLNRPGTSTPLSATTPLKLPIDGSPQAPVFEHPQVTTPAAPLGPLSMPPQQAAPGEQAPNPLLAGSDLFTPQPAIDRLTDLQTPLVRQSPEQPPAQQPAPQSTVDFEVLQDSPLGRILNPLPTQLGTPAAQPPSQTPSLEADLSRQAARDLQQPASLLDLPPDQGQDTFADMLSAVRFADQFTETVLPILRQQLAQHQAAQEQARQQAEARRALQRRLRDDPRLQNPSLSPEERASIENDIRRQIVSTWAAQTLAAPVTTFTGQKDSLVNQHLRQAEQLLADGKYYQAVAQYDIANTIDPDNPLPLLGKGHALIGAGEYRSAVLALLQGISRFPDIARFRLDLRQFLSANQLLDVRRADLEERLAAHEDYQLTFLLGYIEYYSGLPTYGLDNLKRAADQAPPDSPDHAIIRQFVQLVQEAAPLRQQPPATQP